MEVERRIRQKDCTMGLIYQESAINVINVLKESTKLFTPEELDEKIAEIIG